MTRIVVPLAKPGLITVFLLTFMMAWNEFLFAIKLSAFRVRTLPVLISGFIIDRGLLWAALRSGCNYGDSGDPDFDIHPAVHRGGADSGSDQGIAAPAG